MDIDQHIGALLRIEVVLLVSVSARVVQYLGFWCRLFADSVPSLPPLFVRCPRSSFFSVFYINLFWRSITKKSSLLLLGDRLTRQSIVGVEVAPFDCANFTAKIVYIIPCKNSRRRTVFQSRNPPLIGHVLPSASVLDRCLIVHIVFLFLSGMHRRLLCFLFMSTEPPRARGRPPVELNGEG